MWKWVEFVIFLIIFQAACGEDLDRQGDSLEDKDLSDIDRQGWRALKEFQEDDSLWTPYDRLHESPEVPIQKRRRLRKRKRKPTPSSLIDDNLEGPFVEPDLPPRRRVLPQRLEDGMEPWKEMAEEAVKRPNIRRRVTPSYQPSEETENVAVHSQSEIIFEDETIESGQTSEFLFPEETLHKSESHKTTIPDLKAVLKQSGTGSLSEILQQKNLSLSELLMGNQRAISALTETPQDVTEVALDAKTTSDIDTAKYRRVPPSIGLRKEINRNYEQEGESLETLTSRELLEAQRKRLSLLSHKDNKLFPTVTKYDVITEPTTERRIFVPSHPKYYTSLVFRPDFTLYSEQPTEPIQETTQKQLETTTTSTTPKTVTTTRALYLKPKLKNLPVTSAKINKPTTKAAFKIEESEEENYPKAFTFPKPVQINIQEVAGYKQHFESELDDNKRPLKISIEPNSNKGPSKMLIEPDSNAGHLKMPIEPDRDNGPLKMSIDLSVFGETSSPKKYIQSVPIPINTKSIIEENQEEKVVQATAKDEILEIIRDPVSRERLSRILENRNMTLKELVEQRERGSSQVHLADIFHNKTREPEPKGEPFVGTVNSEYFNSFPLFGRQSKSRTFGEDKSNDHSRNSNPSSTVSSTHIDKKFTTESNIAVTEFPAVKIGLDNTEDRIQPFLRNEFEPDVFPQLPQNNNKKTNDYLKDLEDSREDFSEEELQRLEDVDSTLSLISNDKLNVENSDYQQEEEVFINIPSGVKSAIFVSMAIICLSIVVFLTILLVFKWTQRQTKKINYCNSLSTKIKSPMIAQRRPTNAIKSFMTETLGRKKNYYKSNVQSTDDLWECGRERIPSF